ncbi:hypothetical protein OKW34_003422 [Paraburkholderia youngii]
MPSAWSEAREGIRRGRPWDSVRPLSVTRPLYVNRRQSGGRRWNYCAPNPALRDITLQGNTGTARPARENLRLAGLFVGTEMQRGKASFPHFRSVHYPYGTAQISVDPQLLASFEIKGKLPRTVIIVTVHAAYFHCSKALVRSDLWNPTMHVSRHNLPSAGQMHRRLSGGVFDGETYDRELPQRTLAG